jgi:hypothetical protein
MHDHTLAVDGVSYATKIAPPLAITGASMFGLPLSDWVYILTIFYTLLQTGYFLWKLLHRGKNGIEDDGGE